MGFCIPYSHLLLFLLLCLLAHGNGSLHSHAKRSAKCSETMRSVLVIAKCSRTRTLRRSRTLAKRSCFRANICEHLKCSEPPSLALCGEMREHLAGCTSLMGREGGMHKNTSQLYRNTSKCPVTTSGMIYERGVSPLLKNFEEMKKTVYCTTKRYSENPVTPFGAVTIKEPCPLLKSFVIDTI